MGARPENRIPRGPGKVPWVTGDWGSFPSMTVAGQEVSLVKLSGGYSTACDAYFNPNGNTIPAATYELRLYAMGQNFQFLAAKVTLTGAGTQRLAACMAVREWDVRVGLLANTAPPTWTRPPTVSAIAHGRENS